MADHKKDEDHKDEAIVSVLNTDGSRPNEYPIDDKPEYNDSEPAARKVSSDRLQEYHTLSEHPS